MQNKPQITQTNPHRSIKKILIRISLVIAIVVLFLLSYIYGLIPFAFGTAKCLGLPTETNDFMASYSYKVPGDEGYGIHPLASYKYCSAKDAAAHGYRHSVLTTAGKAEQDAIWKKHQEERKFSLSKVDYILYVPSKPYAISNLHITQMTAQQSGLESPQNHTLFDVSKNGQRVGQVRELKVGDAYNICQSINTPSDSYCKVVGEDNKRRKIRREYTKDFKGNWHSYYIEETIGNTGIILMTNSNSEAIAFFNTLTQYTEK